MSGEVILTIDDDEAIRNSFIIYLSDCGYEPITARNGIEGLEIFDLKKPDVVLIDLRMPEMNGFDVISHLKERSPDTPLIVVSGVGEIDDAINAIRLGAWDYMTKPVKDLSALHHVIEKSLERARLIKENKAYREELEAKVESRTQELTEANQNLTRINERLRKIVASSRNLSTCTTIDQFASCALDEFSHHVDASGGSFYLLDSKGLILIHNLDEEHAAKNILYPLHEKSVFAKALKRKTPLLVNDINREKDLITSGWKKYRYPSLLVFPLVDESNFVTAVIALHNKSTPNFSAQDKEMGSILASFCGESLRTVRATTEISRSENRLNLAIMGAELGTWDWHLPSGNVMFNEQWGRMTGYHIDEIEQNRESLEKLIFPDDLKLFRKKLNQHLAGETQIFECEYRIKHKSGYQVWILNKGRIIEKDASGNPIRMCGTFMNITS